jgi:hypothetical protein
MANGIMAEVSADIVELLAAQWDAKLRADAIANDHIARIRKIASDMYGRLREEVDALARRSNLNLVIGIAISLVGIGLLAWFVVVSTTEITSGQDATHLAMRMVIRVSLALFVQVFAYFFLRLYRYGIFEIKFFQNEITAIELKVMALETALQSGDKKAVEKIALEMSRSERNTILKKGERSITADRDDAEREYDKGVGAKLDKLLERVGPK